MFRNITSFFIPSGIILWYLMVGYFIKNWYQSSEKIWTAECQISFTDSYKKIRVKHLVNNEIVIDQNIYFIFFTKIPRLHWQKSIASKYYIKSLKAKLQLHLQTFCWKKVCLFISFVYWCDIRWYREFPKSHYAWK